MKQILNKIYLFLLVSISALAVFLGGLSLISCSKIINGKVITVGAKNFTEGYIVGSMISLLLRENGFEVREVFGAGSMIMRLGLITGQIDIYPEYTGTAWTLYLGHKEKIADSALLYRKVKNEDFIKNDLIWFNKTSVNNTYALAVRKEDIKRVGKSLSSLAEYTRIVKSTIRFGIAHEFFERPDGFKEMTKMYKFKMRDDSLKIMEIGLSFEAIKRDQIDVAMVFSTDGKLKSYNLVLLEDDKKFFPIYNMAFVINKAALLKYPEIKDILDPLTKILNNDSMQKLNYQVDIKGLPAEMVAQMFLRKHKLIK